MPGLIDGHMHIESTMMTLAQFAQVVVPHGTTTVIIDPHEFANVMGIEGIRYALASGRDLPLTVYAVLSSCVPASPLESPRQILSAADLLPLLEDDRVLGLAEMMDVPGVLHADPQVLAKIEATRARGRADRSVGRVQEDSLARRDRDRAGGAGIVDCVLPRDSVLHVFGAPHDLERVGDGGRCRGRHRVAGRIQRDDSAEVNVGVRLDRVNAHPAAIGHLGRISRIG